jgi:hypothetical protein
MQKKDRRTALPGLLNIDRATLSSKDAYLLSLSLPLAKQIRFDVVVADILYNLSDKIQLVRVLTTL